MSAGAVFDSSPRIDVVFIFEEKDKGPSGSFATPARRGIGKIRGLRASRRIA
ncbi:MAG: hypothetical protein ACI82F_000427 [Planctomycetota bacterium]|jgi:hypothetical protein